MTVVRRLARPLLSSVFLREGVETLRRPEEKANDAAPVAPKLAERLRVLPADPRALVTLTAAVQVGAGTLLALGRMPRISSLALAATLVPSTLTEHRYWAENDPSRRDEQQRHFVKNLSLLGALALAAVDTQGRPGLAWRTRHATRHASSTTRRATRHASLSTRRAGRRARRRLPG